MLLPAHLKHHFHQLKPQDIGQNLVAMVKSIDALEQGRGFGVAVLNNVDIKLTHVLLSDVWRNRRCNMKPLEILLNERLEFAIDRVPRRGWSIGIGFRKLG